MDIENRKDLLKEKTRPAVELLRLQFLPQAEFACLVLQEKLFAGLQHCIHISACWWIRSYESIPQKSNSELLITAPSNWPGHPTSIQIYSIT
ncbi:12107_t:CDS:2 [Funneliformis mosseae]|uniref:12107_t:CDS:1 n=1 Tax=Funneliformis mosseae TaxID=27381 RepID=A0A9N9B4I0_FUNMO|nr:12107_t:CDS:2 [Funneliformis mosseae]